MIAVEQLPARLAAKIAEGPPPSSRPDLGPCHLWTATRTERGYGQTWWEGAARLAHGVVYRLLVGPVPPGWEVDHLCFVTACVNPAHLEAVTPEVNRERAMAAGRQCGNALRTSCPEGHPYDEVDPEGKRRCGSCRREKQRERSRRYRLRRAGISA